MPKRFREALHRFVEFILVFQEQAKVVIGSGVIQTCLNRVLILLYRLSVVASSLQVDRQSEVAVHLRLSERFPFITDPSFRKISHIKRGDIFVSRACRIFE